MPWRPRRQKRQWQQRGLPYAGDGRAPQQQWNQLCSGGEGEGNCGGGGSGDGGGDNGDDDNGGGGDKDNDSSDDNNNGGSDNDNDGSDDNNNGGNRGDGGGGCDTATAVGIDKEDNNQLKVAIDNGRRRPRGSGRVLTVGAYGFHATSL